MTGLEFMGKKWDRLDVSTKPAKWESGGGFSSPGIGKRDTDWPSYSATQRYGTTNPTCAECGGRLRGAKKCSCPKPHDHWKPIGKRRNPENEGLPDHQTGGGMAAHLSAMHEWHFQWLQEAFRVLQPGGVIKAFSGTRTFHRMVSAMKAAGFSDLHLEAWNYGSGFPKSLNIGKALDKAGTAQNADLCAFRSALEEARNQKGLSRTDVSEVVVGTRSGACWNWESGLRVPTGEHWNKLVEILDLPSAMTGLRDAAERAVVGKGVAGLGKNRPAFEGGYRAEYNLTTPATEAAQLWNGWGTALKPSWEPVVVGRKP